MKKCFRIGDRVRLANRGVLLSRLPLTYAEQVLGKNGVVVERDGGMTVIDMGDGVPMCLRLSEKELAKIESD